MKQMTIRLLGILLTAAMLLGLPACGPVKGHTPSRPQTDHSENLLKPAGVFSDGAILQQKKPVPVWGRADSSLEGKTVTVTFAGQKKQAAVKKGSWRVNLDPMNAEKKGQKLTVSCEGAAVEVNNIRVGEVFLACGQSNMTFYVEYLRGETKADILSDCNYPDIAMLMVKEQMAGEPASDITDPWVTPGVTTIDRSRISTVAFLAARKLQKELNVPVGVIVAAFGGTRIETWIPPEKLLEAEKNGLKIYGGVQKKCAYHAMMAPLIPYAFRAMMFYQGEGNSFPPEYAGSYADLAALMVKTRREEFENPEMPFFQVQLPSYEKDCDFSEIRMQQQALDDRLPGCWTTVNYDTGDPQDIHPSDKLKVGNRLADLMLEKLYGRKIDNCYPKAVSAEATEDGVMVQFETGEGGLQIKGDRIMSLEVAGEDGVFYPAGGFIENGDRLIVFSEQVRFPYYVRYGYRSNLLPGSFFGANGLPVMPFRLQLDFNV